MEPIRLPNIKIKAYNAKEQYGNNTLPNAYIYAKAVVTQIA